MKNCRNIRRELSAYLDGELTPSRRAEVETHLASCAHCQRESLELKTLVTGVAALPKLQPAPRFLAEVRRKIARGEDPEAPTWQDYIFRPLWLKVPLGMAVLIAILGLVIKVEHPLPTQTSAPVEFAKEENGENERESSASSRVVEKAEVTDTLKSMVADQTPAAQASREVREASVTSAEPSPPRDMLQKEEKDVGVTTTPDRATATDKKQVADGAENKPAAGPTRASSFYSSGELSATPPPSSSPAIGALRSIELAPSKPGETVTVHGRHFNDVRSRAQLLAARCGGQIIDVPQSKEATGQGFFVELPREYMAAFKVELLKTSGSSTTLDRSGTGARSRSADTAAPSTGVLTGNAATSNSLNASGPFGLGDDATAATPTAILEIWVVTPMN